VQAAAVRRTRSAALRPYTACALPSPAAAAPQPQAASLQAALLPPAPQRHSLHVDGCEAAVQTRLAHELAAWSLRVSQHVAEREPSVHEQTTASQSPRSHAMRVSVCDHPAPASLQQHARGLAARSPQRVRAFAQPALCECVHEPGCTLPPSADRPSPLQSLPLQSVRARLRLPSLLLPRLHAACLPYREHAPAAAQMLPVPHAARDEQAACEHEIAPTSLPRHDDAPRSPCDRAHADEQAAHDCTPAEMPPLQAWIGAQCSRGASVHALGCALLPTLDELSPP